MPVPFQKEEIEKQDRGKEEKGRKGIALREKLEDGMRESKGDGDP
jgi:hypothetical protein